MVCMLTSSTQARQATLALAGSLPWRTDDLVGFGAQVEIDCMLLHTAMGGDQDTLRLPPPKTALPKPTRKHRGIYWRCRLDRHSTGRQAGNRVWKLAASSTKRGRNNTAKIYDGAWRKLRHAHLASNPLCVDCRKRGLIVAATECGPRHTHANPVERL